MPEEEGSKSRRSQQGSGLTRDELLSILDERDSEKSRPKELKELGDYIEERSRKGFMKGMEEWQKSQKENSSETRGNRTGNRNQSSSRSSEEGEGKTLLERLLGQ